MSLIKNLRKKEKIVPEPEKPQKEALATHVLSKSAWKILKRPHLSEKAVNLNQLNKYSFLVDVSANKSEIKKEIQRRYGVQVLFVNLLNMKGKVKHFGGKSGKLPKTKKAIVTLKVGQKIETGT